MNDLIQTDDLPKLTLKEARAADAMLRSNAGAFAVQLYLFRAQKGYKAVGCDTFDDYCEDRFDLPRRTIYDWMTRVEATLKVHGLTNKGLLKKCNGCTFDLELLPSRTSAEINRLPSPQIAGKVWEEYKSTRDLATGSEKANINELKRIVTRYLGQSEPGASSVILPADTTLPQERPKPSTPTIAPPSVMTAKEPNLFEEQAEESQPVLIKLESLQVDSERVLFNHTTQQFTIWITLPDGRSCSVKVPANEIHHAQFDGEADSEEEGREK